MAIEEAHAIETWEAIEARVVLERVGAIAKDLREAIAVPQRREAALAEARSALREKAAVLERRRSEVLSCRRQVQACRVVTTMLRAELKRGEPPMQSCLLDQSGLSEEVERLSTETVVARPDGISSARKSDDSMGVGESK
eukprot:CAMPEP_0169280656 /NCGR_PEP_ID=MMETSP1016-20121227/55745_1 /TAXON_ID=342587 /ORGANISM="Karlodinium micrum, Strain CCMP2283" /LENGTH=139 /DNA_ID=CAMNT_0009369039 /DNA_START=65 /DNA_END=482 /DNA_ORIENTATION=+